ncbi:MAG TPA: non-ribosomal peptide synthetase, partial [Pyrinomonadaceae bacterium]
FFPLSVGIKSILARNALELPQLPAKDEVSLMSLVPSAMAELIRAGDVPDTVKTINLGGEAVNPELPKQIYEQTGASQVLNVYGPTEDTVYSTFSLIPKETNGLVPIGRPIACSQVYLLDQHLQPVPVGVTAEVYLGGAGLARGYLRRPALTAEKFIPNPFATKPGARLYRTGDLARYLPDGNIQYLGRMDHQVKIRGFRIELGEIEAALAGHSIVRDVVVVMREDTPGDKRLVAYVVLNEEIASPANELRGKLKDKLPSFMIPSTFIFLEEMPLTANGKIDRKALPAPDGMRPDIAESFAAPRTPIEEMMATIWSEVMEIEKVGIHDNFFSLGGHSLLATQVVNRVLDTFNVELPLRLFFETPTVAAFASYVAESQMGEADDATLSAALAELSQLSEEEREALLSVKSTPGALPQK